MSLKDEIIIVFTHVPNRACAEAIAHTLLTDNLAACVNISSPVRSIYRWQGQIEQAEEIALTIKTSGQVYAALATKLQKLHPYELPEIVAIHASEGLPAYLQWVLTETRVSERNND